MTLAPGTKLGGYEIVAPLGAGGMGEVWRARDTKLGRDVAIKVLPAAVAGDASRLARLEREAKTVAGLNHPNIVTLYAIEEVAGARFLAMELVDGRTLDQIVVPGGLPLARVLDLGVPLADALAAAHERGVVHRDLKPANVMLTREGRLKVLDFGLAKSQGAEPLSDATQAATVAAPISTVGQVLGTVPYMAPEQIRGEATDARTDLFALGILLYELLAGRRPFGGATNADVTSAILRDAAPPVREARADLPADLERIVGRCLEKDPERRFQTAKDVRNELELLRRAPAAASATVREARAATRDAAAERPSVAVLPFANRSRDEEDEYFAEGLADELLNVLAKIRGLRVAARTSSARFKGSAEDVATIGARLGVAALLEGSVRKSGNRVRIAVHLVQVSDGFHLWSETFDRTLDDIFAVQDDIAQAVVKELRRALLGEEPDSKASGEVKAEVAAAVAGRGSIAEAHRLFLEGRWFAARFAETDTRRGIALLRRAVELDPGHALAWACLSSAAAFLAVTATDELESSIREARDAAERALALGPDLPEALGARAWIALWYDLDWRGAVADVTRALERAPGDPDLMGRLAMGLHMQGRFAEAADLGRRALELDPLNVANRAMLARVLAASGDAAGAEEQFRKAIELSPESTSMHCLLAFVLCEQGRSDEALAAAEREPVEWARLYALAVVHALAGRGDDSRRALDQLVALGSESAAFQIAVAHAVRGDSDEAFAWLDRAYDQRDSGLLFLLGVRQLRPLHGDPRWRPLCARLGFAEPS